MILGLHDCIAALPRARGVAALQGAPVDLLHFEQRLLEVFVVPLVHAREGLFDG